MRDKTHMESIETWAKHVKEDASWKKEHTKFIDAQFEKSNKFYKKLAQTPGGKQKIQKLRALKIKQ